MKHARRVVRGWGLSVAALGFLLLPAAPASASGIESSGFTVDFTTPHEAIGLARWSHPDVVQCWPEGLGWDGSVRSSMEASIEVTKPVVLGHPWWTATNASVHVELVWKGPQVAKIHGHVHLRHSPDLAHWSDWTTVPRFDAAGDRTRHIHALQLSRPRPEAGAWHRLVRSRTAGQPKLRLTRYAEVAAWAEKKRPGYLARVKPFFGYMQFRYEGSFPSRHYLQSMKIRVSQVIPGPSYPGRVEGEDGRAAHELPWSHRAPGTLPPEATRHREGQSRAVLAAAVQSVIDAATPDGEKFQHVSVVGRTAFGGDLQDLDVGGALPTENPFGSRGAKAWRDVLVRNRRSRLTPGGLPTEPLPSYVTPERASYVMDGGRPGREDPGATWARFHARHKKSLGLVWVTEPGIAPDGSLAIVHVSHARSAAAGTGRWVLLDLTAGAWRVLKTIPTGKR